MYVHLLSKRTCPLSRFFLLDHIYFHLSIYLMISILFPASSFLYTITSIVVDPQQETILREQFPTEGGVPKTWEHLKQKDQECGKSVSGQLCVFIDSKSILDCSMQKGLRKVLGKFPSHSISALALRRDINPHKDIEKLWDSNPRASGFDYAALPAELQGQHFLALQLTPKSYSYYANISAARPSFKRTQILLASKSVKLAF